jgi:2-polyprenyl-3-methyl-5-hydroxy-6-metoxy-1,4-benzoquinol methylase
MGRVSLSSRLFHMVTVKDYTYAPETVGRPVEVDERSDADWLERMAGNLDFRGKSVLDLGCGNGTLCALAARHGAARVVGVDLNVSETAEGILTRYPDLRGRVEFVATVGDASELGDEVFDLVTSKDSMEHFPEPESFVRLMTERVRPGGELAIGFSPLWKSPKGGHIGYMTKLPWAHLIFPEKTIMAERRRFRPHENADHWDEVAGGLNQMTLGRFERIIAGTGFTPIYMRTNVGDRPGLKAFRELARIPGLREYFTVSVYGVWRKPRPISA